MPKRSAHEAIQAVMPASKADSSGLPRHKSRSGRVVKPKVWDDGTVAAPVLALKEELPAEELPGERGEAGAGQDPDYSDDAVEEHLSDDHGAAEYEGGEESDDGNFSDGPTGSYGSHGSRGRYGASRDESGKFTHGGRARGGRGKASHRGGGGGGGGGIFKMAAVEVLRQEKRLLSTGEIARLALKRGLIKCSGKTPEATMASALYTDIKRREGQSIFIRPHEGLFGLREWIEQGVPFQDDYAEEMAKRARANFGYLGVVGGAGAPGLLPPPAVVDRDGKPIGPLPPYSYPYGAAMGMPGMDPSVMPAMGLPPIGLPPIPGYSAGGGGGKGKGSRGGSKGTGASQQAQQDDDDEGLMQLLNAAEELHRSSSKEAEEWEEVQRDDMAVDKPAGAGAGEEEEGQGAGAPSSIDKDLQRGGSQASQGGAAAAVAAAAAALCRPLSSAPSAGAPPSEGGSKGDGIGGEDESQGVGSERGRGEGTPESEPMAEPACRPSAGLAGLASLMQGAGGAPAGYPYPPYYPPFPYYHPHLRQGQGPQQQGADSRSQGEDEDEMEREPIDREGSGAISLVVRGSSRPLPRAAQQQQGCRLGLGQEQVNILNLPLPDFEGCVAKASEAPLPAVSSEQLREQEALVMRLEQDMGTSHPEVGKALLSLAKLYMAEGGPNSRHLATAAISRAQDVMTVCQVALSRQTTCGSAFAYLMEKAKSVPCAPRAVDITVAAGDAALIGLASPPPQ